jgi:hypothetical protein
MEQHPLLVERSHVAADVANVELGMRDVQRLVARHAMTRDQAECVLAECIEELKRLGARLGDIDQRLTAPRR